MKARGSSRRAAPADALDRLLQLAHEEGALGPKGLSPFARALRERAEMVLAERVATAERRAGQATAAHDRLAEFHAREVAERRSELEALRAEREAAVTAHDRAVEHHAREAAGLRSESEALRAEREAAVGAHDRAVAHHAREMAELRSELEALRTEREAAVAAHDRAVEHHVREAAAFEAAVVAHDRAVEHHTREVAGLRSELEALRGEREAAAAAHDRLALHHRAVLEDVARVLEAGLSRLPWRPLALRRQLADLVAALRKEIG
jgi:chromosome segregation ATPase